MTAAQGGGAGGSGRFRQRLKFEIRKTGSDGAGNVETSGWTTQFTVAARVRYRIGGEEVVAARLQGVQPVSITVRSSSQTLQIDPSWRAYDARHDVAYDIKSVANMDEKNRFLEIMAVAGDAASQGSDA